MYRKSLGNDLFFYQKTLFTIFFEGISIAPVFEETNLLCKVQVSATTKIINLFPIVVKPVPESSTDLIIANLFPSFVSQLLLHNFQTRKSLVLLDIFLKRKQFAL